MRVGPFCARLLTNYRGHGKRRGIVRFANGFTLRWGRIAAHFWKLGPNDYVPSRLK